MIDALLGDSGIRKAAAAARPDDDPAATIAQVAWSVLAEPGDGVAGALISQLGAIEALRFGLSGERFELAEKAIQDGRRRWLPRAQPRAIGDALHGAAEVGAQLLLPGDAEWSAAIDDLGDHAPAVLWVRGDPTHLVASSRVSIVGARAATAYGDTVAAELAGDLAATGSIVVSGGAYGIDGSAHRAALGAGGGTIAFLAGGVDRAYPAGHQHLFDRIRESGALVSELPCGAAPTKFRFLSRNRLIAALGAATVVVEAGWRSGSLNTAGHASSLGRPLGAVPGPITSAASAGCHRLMREYDAQCVTNAAEVRELMGIDVEHQGPEQRADPDQTRLLDALSTRTPHPPAEIARSAGLSVERTRALLGTLSLEGRVEQIETGWRRTTA
ncbi:DNA-processing protein DprA [Microbacterium aerolatum]|uniref:DNA processing protein DprA n=1 Tax=Microbacterium aerolatum TaxID=153731 RepID=A0A511AII6_9MICO|nr:DNA-processing protein DprA [Microbacterium aerolatum]GEK87856.1 DNA processing protein DprA [Microbacterium aerolatum]GGB25988.1 DNA processing protein DprA [Microbacterium aerolatum]